MKLSADHLVSLLYAAAMVLCLAINTPSLANTFTVAPNGLDSNPGTPELPFATLQAARDAARKAEAAPHRIVVTPGEYFLTSPLVLEPQDSGLTIEAGEGGTVTLYGGSPLTGWQPDGEMFWAADVPEVKAGTWDFRALVVNGRMPERARFPESGTLLHKSVFDVRWLSSVGGGWDRKPTDEELNTMLYDPQDIPATLDVRCAEVRVYHMWDESMVGVKANDTQRHALLFSTPTKSPPGAFGVKKYVIFNTREGMTRPGQWYLDRTRGKVVYWPLPQDDMTKAKVVAPRLERLIQLAGNQQKEITGVTLRNLTLQATTTPLMAGGFGAYAFDGAIRIDRARNCTLEALDISCVGGWGVQSGALNDSQIVDCRIHHTGAGAVRTSGAGTLIARNHIHHVGLYYPSAIAVGVNGSRNAEGKSLHLYRNEIHDTPYTGIAGGGEGLLIEENLISRVMLEMHDGGAIYGGMKEAVLRGNVVRDVVKIGEGYGVSAYYLDEGARDCIVENNVSIGVDRPTHNHIAANITIRNNVFVSQGDMSLSFQRSADCRLENNTLVAPGNITVAPPNAVTVWKGNRVFRNGLTKDGGPQRFTIDDAMPPVAEPKRMTWSASALRVAAPPTLDAEIGSDEWPGELVRLDRAPSRWSASGAPVYARLCYDDQSLYVALNFVTFDVTRLRNGTAWGEDDGAEIALAGRTADGQATSYVLRGYPGGALQSVTDAGAPGPDAERLGRAVRFAAKPYGKTRGGWKAEWAIPWNAFGLKPESGMKIPFNLTIYRSEDNVWRCWEGTLGESWQLDQAGTLQLK
jgi:parallel beta-helix repeat protein